MQENRPAPLVSPEVDLSEYSSFLLDVDRVLSSELLVLATPEEGWAAFQLWCRAWKQSPPGSLPSDDRVLAAFSGAGKRWPKVKAMALRNFVECDDGRLYHEVLAGEVANHAWRQKVARETKRAHDADRLRKWREKNGSETPVETPAETVSETVSERVRNGVNRSKENGSKKKEDQKQSQKHCPAEPPDGSPENSVINGKDLKTREFRQRAIEVLNFLNDKAGRNFQPVPANVDPIVTRFREGFTAKQMHQVVALKCRAWKGDEKMAPFLRPDTLFNRTKFANYAGELVEISDEPSA